MMPLVALGIGQLGSSAPAPWLSWAYALVFVLSGAYMAGAMIGRTGYLLDVTQGMDRASLFKPLGHYDEYLNGLLAEFVFREIARKGYLPRLMSEDGNQ